MSNGLAPHVQGFFHMNALKRWVIAIFAAMVVGLILTMLGFHSPTVPIAGGFTAVFTLSFLKTRNDIRSKRR
jgi:membrane-associated phospholipid phosphatase